MKHIYLNLKRFDICPRYGGVNRLAPAAEWGRTIVERTQEALRGYRADEAEFVMYFPEAHILPAAAAKTPGSPVKLGCQGLYRADTAPGGNFGAFTANRTGHAMAQLGCESVLIGHCEERADKLGLLTAAGAESGQAAAAVNRVLNEEIRAAQAAGHVSCCGIAGGCESYTQLHRIYTQADKALEVALSSNNRQVCVYDGLVLELLLAPLSQESRTAFLDRIWGNAKKDMEEMLDFLEIYFACNGSVQAISQKLFIHKNTVQYKIKKIAEATGYDPRKLSDAVLLYLCVRLRKA